jgi:UDP-N-acetylmuramate--alanine ligase
MKDAYKDVFKGLKELYWVPSYLAREDPNLTVITPGEFVAELEESANAKAAELDDNLKNKLIAHANNNNLVILFTGGGGGSLDEWARTNLVA